MEIGVNNKYQKLVRLKKKNNKLKVRGMIFLKKFLVKINPNRLADGGANHHHIKMTAENPELFNLFYVSARWRQLQNAILVLPSPIPGIHETFSFIGYCGIHEPFSWYYSLFPKIGIHGKL